MAAYRNATIVIGAIQANRYEQAIIEELEDKGLPITNITSSFPLGKDRSKPRSLKCIFNSEASAKEFVAAA